MLPTTVMIKKECLEGWDQLSDYEKEEVLNDYLSDTYGFLHEGYSYEETDDAVIIDRIMWEIDEDEDFD